MSAQQPALAEQVIKMTPTEAIEKALDRTDPNAGLVVAVMYQSLIAALDEILDEYEFEPEVAIRTIQALIAHLDLPDTPTLN